MAILNKNQWDDIVSRFPDTHLLQTTQWGELKKNYGWQVERVSSGQRGFQIMYRRLPLGFSFAYIPRGPSLVIDRQLLSEIDDLSREKRAIFLKYEPDLWENNSVTGDENLIPGFEISGHNIQPRRTLIIDISGTEEKILAGMKQKTRYNIRLARKKGVHVRQSSDIDMFHSMMMTTALRDGFNVHSNDYFQKAYDLFHPRGMCELLIAEFEHQPLAALMVFAHGTRAWYFYGASANIHRNLMPTYLLQWEAMRWSKRQGCKEYDLWGVPDEDHTTLEENFLERKDGLWGVYRYKRGFGGQLYRNMDPMDRVYKPILYRFYKMWQK